MSESTSSPSSALLTRLLQFDVNPVWVKDLRQASRSWIVTGTLLLMLLVFYLISLGAVIFGETQNNAANYLGPTIFGTIGFTSLVAAYIFIPIYIGVRTMMERISINADLQYISIMSPQKIIWGKVLSSVYLIVLFYSAAVPFLVFSYLLRGIDLPTILLVVALTFTLNVLLTMGAIVIALAPLHTVMKILAALFVGGNAIFAGIVIVGTAVADSVITRGLSSADFWQEFIPFVATYLVDFLILAGLLYQVAVAFITPSSANRSLPLRRYVTFMTGAIIIQFLLWAWFDQEQAFVLPIVLGIGAISVLGMFFCIGGRDDLSIRVKRTIPTSPFKRFIAFFFYNGTLSCLLWLLILWLATMTCLFGFNILWDNHQRQNFLPETQVLYFYIGSSLYIFYAFAYALLGVWLHRTFFPKRTPKLATLFLVLLIILPFLFLMIFYFIFTQKMIAEDWVLPGMVINVGMVMANSNDDERNLHLMVHLGSVLFMILVALALNFKWLKTQITQFRPYKRKPEINPPLPPLPPSTGPNNELPPVLNRG